MPNDQELQEFTEEQKKALTTLLVQGKFSEYWKLRLKLQKDREEREVLSAAVVVFTSCSALNSAAVTLDPVDVPLSSKLVQSKKPIDKLRAAHTRAKSGSDHNT